MKKCIALLLVSACLLSLAACGAKKSTDQGSVTFYYPRLQYQFNGQEKVIAAEQRTLSGNRNDLSYLLTLYVLGPLDEELSSPFPSRASILDIRQEEDILEITLSDMDSTVSDTGFTLVGACLAMTLFGLTEYETVHIHSGGRDLLLAREDILLTDDITSAGEPTEEIR